MILPHRLARTICPLLVWLAVTLAALAAPSTTTPADTILEPTPPKMLGVWQQTGGGVFLVISEKKADFYHSTKFISYKDVPASGKLLSDSYARGRLENDDATLILFREDLGDRFDQFFSRDEFRRVPALPSNVVDQPGEDARFKQPEFIFDLVWHHFDEQFGFFKQRHFDWAERYRRFRPKVTATTTDEELYAILTAMLAGLGDSHTRIYWEQKKEPFRSGQAKVLDYLDALFAQQTAFKENFRFRGDWLSKQKAAVESELAEAPFARTAANKIRYGKLKGNVGYLEMDVLTQFGPSGSTRKEQLEILERAMDQIIDVVQDCRAVIIDLSFNQGGADVFGAVIASRFADQRRHVVNTYMTGQDPSTARPLFLSPRGPKQFTKSVYVLTTDSTVSAGETLTLMLRAFPHVRQVGEATRGCLSSFLNKGMPNAFQITLSNEFWFSPGGAIFEGAGVPPHLSIPVFEKADLLASYPRAVRQVRDLAIEER